MLKISIWCLQEKLREVYDIATSEMSWQLRHNLIFSKRVYDELVRSSGNLGIALNYIPTGGYIDRITGLIVALRGIEDDLERWDGYEKVYTEFDFSDFDNTRFIRYSNPFLQDIR